MLELTGRRSGVIFTTAYDEHAIKAFELHAVDYLLKPFSQTRFDAALERARALHDKAPEGLDTLVSAGATPIERVLIRDRDQVHVIAVDSIECIEAQGDYLAVTADGKTYLKPQRLSEIEQQLDERRFLRLHRSFIVNLAFLASIEKQGSERHLERLRSGKRIPISRSGYERLRQVV